MNLREYLKEKLATDGYEGLCNDDCGCELDDLMPCDEPSCFCEPGYKIPCNCDQGCNFHIVDFKPLENIDDD